MRIVVIGAAEALIYRGWGGDYTHPKYQ